MMRTIGLIGGMAWESSAEYYRLLNTEVRRRLGGHHNARSILLTVDFAEIERLQRDGDWATAGRLLAGEGKALQAAGADMVLLCTNTMHYVAADIEAAIDVPFVHLMDATAAAITTRDFSRVGLLGTRFTMEMGFYVDRMAEHGIEALTPHEGDRARMHDIIYDELTQGVVDDGSRRAVVAMIDELAGRGAQGVILGCTEITLLIGEADSPLPVFDSTAIHVQHAVDLAVPA